MVEAQISGIKVRFYFGFFAAVFLTFFYSGRDTQGILAALISCFLHELGHIFAMIIFSSPPEKICFYAGGIKIIPARGLFDRRSYSAAILMAGCIVNFIVAAVSEFIGLSLMCEINLTLGAFNLLPFSYFDGGRLLQLYAGENFRKVLSVISAVAVVSAFFLSGIISPVLIIILWSVILSEIFL